MMFLNNKIYLCLHFQLWVVIKNSFALGPTINQTLVSFRETENNIMFDFSAFLSNLPRLYVDEVLQTVSDGLPSDAHVSSYLYFSTDTNVSPVKNSIFVGRFARIDDVSFIFQSKEFYEVYKNLYGGRGKFFWTVQTLHSAAIKYNLNTLIFNVEVNRFEWNTHAEGYKPVYECLCRGLSNDLPPQIKNISKNINIISDSIMLGLQIDEELMTCCGGQSFDVLSMVNISVLNVGLVVDDMILSPGIFLENLEILIEKHRKFVKKVNSDCVLLVRIKLTSRELTKTIQYLYQALIKDYIKFWTQSQHREETIVIQTFPIHISTTSYKYQLKRDIVPFLQSGTAHANHFIDNLLSPCQLHQIIRTVSSSFDSILLSYRPTNWFHSLFEKCDETAEEYLSEKLKIYYDLHTNNYEKFIHTLVNVSKQFSIKGVFFPPFLNSSITIPEALIAQAQSIKIGCHYMETDYLASRSGLISNDFVTKIVLSCGNLFNISKTILVDWTFNDDDYENLPNFLFYIKSATNQFKSLYPNKKLRHMIVLSTVDDKFFNQMIIPDLSRTTLYCEKALQKKFEMYNAVATYFKIHSLGTIVLQSVINMGAVGGWWSNLDIMKNVNRSATNFPLLVQRNLPQNLQKDMTIANSYKCINWAAIAKRDGIIFHRYFAGSTINLTSIRNSSLKLHEIRTVLLFSYGKFSSSEIILRSNENLKNLNDALSSSFLNAISSFENKSLLIEMEFNFIKSHQMSISTSLDNLNFTSLGIHVANWEIAGEQFMQQFVVGGNGNKENFNKNLKFGFTLANCLDHLNTRFYQIRKLNWISNVKYIVCDLPPVLTINDNQHKMQTFLGSNFYIKMFFESFSELKNIELYLRVNYFPVGCSMPRTRIANFLRFLSDVNQHAEIYQIKYFLVPAISTNYKSGPCSTSWWILEDTLDISNISAYSELESQYFGRPTKPALVFDFHKELNILETSDDNIILVGIFLLLIFVSLVVILLLVKLKGIRRRYLSEEEMEDFKNGKTSSPRGALAFEDMKFLEDFEVAKHNVELCTIIGRGNFGLVYRGILNDEISVAVKMPHSECSKDSFKSMLTEMKILTYIGKHPYVLSIIATYTKEVAKGQIYIITELCENGNLQIYLRSRKGTEFIDLYELYMFSYQIASGMEYISGQNVVHGDLSTRNVLLTSDGTCKIGDFGLSRKLYEYHKYVKKNKEPLPWRWMALESLKDMEFTTKSDVWAYGVTLWEIFSLGDLPYPGVVLSVEFLSEVENGMRLPIAKYAAGNIYEQMKHCWNILPENRPNFQDLAQFFAILRNQEYDAL